jgi:hypothetical protein
MALLITGTNLDGMLTGKVNDSEISDVACGGTTPDRR